MSVRASTSWPTRLLRRHICDRAHHHAGVRLDLCLVQSLSINCAQPLWRQLGESEVQHLHDTVASNHDVFRLDVAVNDAGLVSRLQRRGYLRGDVEHFTDCHPRVGHVFSQSFAVDELRDDEVTPVDLANFIDRDDVGMIERRGGLRLLLESTQLVRIVVEGSWEQLERHFTVEFRVQSQIDFTHPTGA